MARQNRRDIFDPNEVGAFHAVQQVSPRKTPRLGTLRGPVLNVEHFDDTLEDFK